jgi:acetyltransferase-like isoleucine patch superfamily enzyme/GT2 family glycosyltransferase
MRVSVIIPTYNSADLVVEGLRSILAQSYSAAEVIIVDDGSTDDTRERVAALEPAVRYVRQTNQGVAAARNRGLLEATGDVVAFLDADDVWHKRKLELQLRCLQDEPGLGLLGTLTVDWPREPFPSVDGAGAVRARGIRFDELVVRNTIVTSSVVVRREVLNKVGEFDTALHGPEDFDLWLRVARVAGVANLPMALTGYRNVAGSLGKQAAGMESGGRLILSKLEADGALRGRPLLRRKAKSYLFFSCAYLHTVAGNQAGALRLMSRSLSTYPLPYRRAEVRMPLARARLLLRTALRCMRNRPRAGQTLTAAAALGAQSQLSDPRMSLTARLRRGEGPVWRRLKSLAKAVLTFHVPADGAARPFFSALYRAHVVAREFILWAGRFFWFEPIFRSQCEAIGAAFRMESLPYLQGKGRIRIGTGVRLSGKSTISFSSRAEARPELVIGDGSFVGHQCAFHVARSVRIGNHCLLAGSVRIFDMDGHPTDAQERRSGAPTPAEGIRRVILGDDVWVGGGAIILKGVTIGDRSIVAAGSVVTRAVPPDTIVAGNPARVVRTLAPAETTAKAPERWGLWAPLADGPAEVELSAATAGD